MPNAPKKIPMLGATISSENYLTQLNNAIDTIDHDALQRWSDLIYRAWENGNFVFVIGNGGSATSASHFAEDLGKSTLIRAELGDESKKRLKVMSLTDNVGWITAAGNDLGYEDVYVQQLMNYGSAGDVLIAISGSGNSRNILKPVDWANRHGLTTYGLSGYDGGKLKEMQQDGITVDKDDMGIVESVHLCIFHWVLDDVYGRINQVGRHAPAKQ